MVQFGQQYGQQTGYGQNPADDEDAVWGTLGGRSIPTLKFTVEQVPGSGVHVPVPIGTTLGGVLKENIERRQAMDFETKQPATWQDGRPKYDIILTLATEYSTGDPDDDGTRRVFARGTLLRALQDEMRRLGVQRFGVGTQIAITLTGFKSNGPQKQPSKLYDVKLSNVQPFVSKAELEAQQAFGQGPHGVQQQGTPSPWQQVPGGGIAQASFPPAQQQYQQPPVQPQQVQYANPAQPAFPGQVVPQQQAAPVAAAAPAAPAVGQQHIDQFNLLVGMGTPPETAIQAVAANAAGGDPQFTALLEAAVIPG